ncbi:hypothetical protein SDRG_12226 [Saprolegnia diclina VS20]|uniref:Uncharacterized protein n=1 Tax=Saprolegnia diclina (strain VS20) TaxID=1156394 RepID=T0PWS0_SAPDV|nr:hypothetical protein SDRG_12226 [Saprolegnia diclina VS20]EQC29944.1 hypothetical protein SDRG_12226 [Saprolegnia diclina VS20]|eukprot:XP_008616511.1 hypothetical protein SDRG_12226 [Saprolegnia diclina VS20]
MNGATCTTADFVFFDELVHTPMWANCSSVPKATLLSIVPEDYDSAMKLCASDNCTSFVNSLSHLWPKCAHDEENGELIPSFNEIFSCTPSPRDEPCAMVDIFKMKKLTETTPIWTNCSKYLGLAVDATFATIGPDRLEDAAVPSGYCVSPCPAYILYVLKHVMPPCTFQHPVVNPTPLYSLCPSTRPPSSAMGRALGSSTLTVMMAALLV